MRTVEESRRRWETSQQDGGDLEPLQRAVKFSGPASPCEAGCRSVCWKTFLLFRDVPAPDRSLAMREARDDYEALHGRYMQFIKHPELLAELTVDPLADDPESPWDAFRRDETVRAEILQDVRRLPDHPFLHQEDTQMLILDVLFIYCKQNPDVGGYRQGMHELLAPIVYVLNEDAVQSTGSQPSIGAADADMVDMLDGRFIEHDAYALFAKIMDRARAFYETSNPSPESTDSKDPALGDGILPSLAPAISAAGVEESAIVDLSREIHEGTLMKVDPELALHLKNIEILPQIFLIRWIRLLFGREFPFEQHLVLWDSIFAFDPNLRLVPLICVAMLLRIRWELLDADYSMALQSLLKYPGPQPPHGPHTFVDDAVFLRDHLDAAGGASLILKYTGRTPAQVLSPSSSSPGSTSRPSTPAAAFAAGLGSLRSRTLKVARSPLRSARPSSGSGSGSGEGLGPGMGDTTSLSPSRFLHGRENMEALFQGAAKGVLERGEKLGINRAVRDAVGEIKRNMAQSFQEAKQAANRGPGIGRPDLFSPSSTSRRYSNGQAMRTLEEMDRRNRQLASMLDETVTALKAIAKSYPEDALPDGRDETEAAAAPGQQQQQQQRQWLEAVELAAAKVQFVKVYLEDATLVLPSDEPASNGPEDESRPVTVPEKDATGTAVAGTDTDLASAPPELQAAAPKTPLLQTAAMDAADVGPLAKLTAGRAADEDRMDLDKDDRAAVDPPPLDEAGAAHAPPKPPPPAEAPQPQPHTIPTRSTLAQSSFAWMLEPGDAATHAASATAAGPAATTSAAPKKPTPRPSAAGRGRHAFLFGEVVGQSPLGGGGGGGGSSHQGRRGASGDPLADAQAPGPDGRARSITSDDIFGLEPLRRALPKGQDASPL